METPMHSPPSPERISAQEARDRARSGRALLVCGYDDEAKCRGLGVEGAITHPELVGRLGSLPRDQEIIFFCA